MKPGRILTMIGMLAVCVCATTAFAGQRPLSDFLNAQGTFCVPNDPPDGNCVVYLPPMPNIMGWWVNQPGNTLFGMVDYAGRANEWLIANYGKSASLGTTVTGTVSERPLKDGRAEVEVILHAKNATVWVGDTANNTWPPAPMYIGAYIQDIAAGAPPALANSEFRVTFINTAPGAPLPDLVQFNDPSYLSPGQELLFMAISAQGTGTMADGRPGMVVIRQTAVYVTSGKGATADSFPAELIYVHPIRQ